MLESIGKITVLMVCVLSYLLIAFLCEKGLLSYIDKNIKSQSRVFITYLGTLITILAILLFSIIAGYYTFIEYAKGSNDIEEIEEQPVELTTEGFQTLLNTPYNSDLTNIQLVK